MDGMDNGAAARTGAAVNPLDIRLRPAKASDEAFLKSVHDAGRAWEFEALKAQGLDDLHATIMAQQYSAQHDAYFNAFTLAKYAVIEWCGQPVGRIYVDFRDAELRILDFNILPAWRGKRIGEIVVRAICGRAASERKTVTLSVHPLNRTRGFYHRLGFRPPGVQTGAFIELEWRAPAADPARR